MAAEIVSQASLTADELRDIEAALEQEWLLTNGRGGFASGTPLSIPTRRYHGLLVAAARPPLERWLLLAGMLERVYIKGQVYETACFEFSDKLHPQGFRSLQHFSFSNNSRTPWVRFVYHLDGGELVKEILMPRGRDEVLIRYRLETGPGKRAALEVGPLLAMRDFHSLTQAFEGGYAIQEIDGGYVTVDAYADGPRVWLSAAAPDHREAVQFRREPDWWYHFVYRKETARGLEDQEDLFLPGWFVAHGERAVECTIRAVAAFGSEMHDTPEPALPFAINAYSSAPGVEERLRQAADAFVVKRSRSTGADLTTILAGYPWFGDWGRDTFIALPGLLLETHRFAEAYDVLKVFGSALKDGLVPNRFSDYGDGRDYNSVDASLWYIHAADAYCEASGDAAAWPAVLGPTCEQIVQAFMEGTRHRIHMDSDGLVSCGDPTTHLTWMDAKYGDIVFTPRHGKPVEINALWYHAICLMADRMEPHREEAAARYRQLASQVRGSFLATFWGNEEYGLHDVVRDGWQDISVRPNQIIAVSLAHSPLNASQQRTVLDVVTRELLTPYGLRTLSPSHPSYHGRYEGGMFERDQAYHQGTVWAWLIGPYAEAYLRVHNWSAEAKRLMREQLSALVTHLDDAGLGSINEIFDGDPPHRPHGSIAQAWSVAELLRAWHMTEP